MHLSFLVAWQLLTAIPLGRGGVTLEEPGRSMAWFSLIGLIIGALLAAADFLLSKVWPTWPASALLVVVWVALTGGLHLDGFIDCCDGLLVAKPAEQRLEIMKDSRVGAFGVVGAVSLLVVKFAALVALPAPGRWSWLLVVPALSRWAMVWVVWRYPTARPDGFAVWFRQGLNWPHMLMAGGTALVAALLIRGVSGLIGFVVIWIFALLFALWVRRRIPGLTGDVYGALNELSEVVGLLLAVALGGITAYPI